MPQLSLVVNYSLRLTPGDGQAELSYPRRMFLPVCQRSPSTDRARRRLTYLIQNENVVIQSGSMWISKLKKNNKYSIVRIVCRSRFDNLNASINLTIESLKITYPVTKLLCISLTNIENRYAVSWIRVYAPCALCQWVTVEHDRHFVTSLKPLCAAANPRQFFFGGGGAGQASKAPRGRLRWEPGKGLRRGNSGAEHFGAFSQERLT